MKYLMLVLLLVSLVGCSGQPVDSQCVKIYSKTEAGAGHCYK